MGVCVLVADFGVEGWGKGGNGVSFTDLGEFLFEIYICHGRFEERCFGGKAQNGV